jgi:hypothetical protein
MKLTMKISSAATVTPPTPRPRARNAEACLEAESAAMKSTDRDGEITDIQWRGGEETRDTADHHTEPAHSPADPSTSCDDPAPYWCGTAWRDTTHASTA